MPLAIIAGLAFLALEFAVIGWLLHWLLAGSVSLLVLSILVVLAVTATVIAWASIGVADRADDEMESFMATGGQPCSSGTGARHAAPIGTKHACQAPDGEPGPGTGAPAPISL